MNKKKLSLHLTDRTAKWLILAVYVVLLIPMFAISRYNCPSADDFAMTDTVYHVYQETGSVLAAAAEAIRFAGYDYMHFTGYFTSAALTALNPAVFGEHFYVLVFPVMIVSFSLSFWYMMRCILVRALKADKDPADIVTGLALIIMVQLIPEDGMRTEGLYWYSGAINYTFLFSMAMLFLGLLVTLLYGTGQKKNPSVVRIILTCVLGFLVGGGNYLTALSTAILMAVFLFFCLIRKKISRVTAAPCISMLAGFFISCAAPGNRIRGGEGGMSAVRSILLSLHYTLSYCVSEWTTWQVLLLILLMLPAAWKLAGQIKAKCSHPVLMLFFCYGLVSANMVPALYAVANIEAGRIRVVIWFQYIVVLTLYLVYFLGFIRHRLGLRPERENGDRSVADGTDCILALIVLFLFGGAMDLHVNPDGACFSSALADLRSGTAQAYLAENESRYEIFHDSSVRDVTVTEFENRPALLFFADLDEDPDNWINQAVAVYYGKDSVRAMKSD